MKNNYNTKFNNISHSILGFVLILSLNIYSQAFTDSNLPIIIINTDINPVTNLPLEILDNPRVLSNMKIIKHPDGSRNFMYDQNTAAYLNYNGRISIEIRGSTSQLPPKKPYGLTTLQTNNITNNNVSLLGIPAENDWVLSSIAYDKSFIRDYLCYNLSRQMGNYATRTEYCEVVVNGDYKGLYLLQEKIKVDAGRVDIQKMLTTDNSGTNLTGGYITKSDKLTGGDPLAWLMQGVNFIHHYPKPTDITVQQNDYIKSEFYRLDGTTYNQSLLDGYKTVIDIPSFVDFMLVNELSSNADVYQSSTYFHKDRNGKLRAGPVWDLNITFGSDFSVGGNSQYDQWQFSNGNRVGPDFWFELSDNGSFWCYFKKRWNELKQPGQPMNEIVMNAFMNNTITYISEALARQETRWGATMPNQATDLANLKSWLTQRIIWMNSQLNNFSSCDNVVTPPLVISKIHYNPLVITGANAMSSNDQEFIEITNNGSNTVNLSGVYFRKLGTTYQFPYNSTILGNSTLFLAANSMVFQNKYGFAPFGQYSRNLSNKSQDIVLADAMGNIIDHVEYFDAAPWPTAADGFGSYLQLSDNNLDNNLSSSWFANTTTLSVNNFNYSNVTLNIYPNPANDFVNISSDKNIDKIEIIDIYGKTMKSEVVNDIEYKTDINNFSKGIYFVKIYIENDVKTHKLIKN